MSRMVILLAFALLLGVGCAKPTATPVIVREVVPVPCPPPIIPSRPALPSAQLAVQPTMPDLLRALLADREALAAWALDLETRLKAYQTPTPAKESKR